MGLLARETGDDATRELEWSDVRRGTHELVVLARGERPRMLSGPGQLTELDVGMLG